MANSLRDQLLQAGLVSEEQINKAENEKKRRKTHAQNSKNKRAHSPKKQKKKTPTSDLAHFYQQRTQLERKEKQEANRHKQEAARLKKERRQKVGQLIKTHALNSDEGNIRYNFVIGTHIKYLFVTEQQQQQLSDGKLAITFLGGKKCLIPHAIGEEIKTIDPDKMVILADTSTT